MKLVAIFSCAAFAVGTAMADPYVMARQQAVRASDQNAAEQQRIQQLAGPAAAAVTPPPASAAPMDPALAATLQNVADLRADVAAFNAATNAEPDTVQKISLLNNLSAAAQGTKPASGLVKKLADDLIAAASGKKIPAAQQTKLARDVHALFNSSHLTSAQQQMLGDDAQKILTSAGASADDAASVVADLKAIAAATK
jgi:hypothetical protein